MAKKKQDKKLKRILKKKLQQKKKKTLQQNKLKPVQSKKQSHSKLPSEIQQLLSRPSFADMEAPDGFIPISISQAIMEYGKPLMDLSESEGIKDTNKILKIVQALWNYTLMLNDGNGDDEIKSTILYSIKSTYAMNNIEVAELFKKMVERRNYLFPPEVQIKPSLTLFMKKEVTNLITNFNYNKLDLSSKPITPDTEDKALVKAIIKMDKFMINKADYDAWEDHYFSVEEKCADRFHKWLNEKGLSENSEDFPFYIQRYINFIYNYMHDDIVLLKEVPSIYIEEFFTDYILRKLMIEPHEYVQIIPAIKAFYTFLHEKGYIDNPEPMIELLDAYESAFIEILRRRFG